MSADLFAGLDLLRLEVPGPEKTGLSLRAWPAPRALRKAVARLRDDEYFLEDLLAVDTAEGYLALYHFGHFERPDRIGLALLVPRDNPETPTISDIFPGASWHERECHDFHGLVFVGLENQTPLLLPPEADFHPLRKDDKNRKAAAEVIEPGQAVLEAPGFALLTPAAPDTPAPKKTAKKTEEADA